MAGNIAKRANGKWRARYRDESGKEHSRHFDRKIDAQQWLDAVTSAVVTGTYADPQAAGSRSRRSSASGRRARFGPPAPCSRCRWLPDPCPSPGSQ
jgi:hypothetical protein